MSDERTCRALGSRAEGGEPSCAQARLRAEADRCAALRAQANTPPPRLWQQLLESPCWVARGALAWLLGAYGAHIALDAFAPAGLLLLA